MNINAIQKHYDKLTTRERFALIVAAGMRGDEADRAALLRTAPRKTWSIPTTNGLAEAFNFLSMFHVMDTLRLETNFYFLLSMGDEEDGIFEKMGITSMDALENIARAILANCEAWRVVCSEYGVDPVKILDPLPGADCLELLEYMVKRMYESDPLELSDLQETIEGYRRTIETKRKEWE
ncbi:MAG: hypothetical protein AABZ00_04995 [Chloroflexota bacterium]